MNHTKEPWKLDGGQNRHGDYFIWQSGEYFGGHAIATVHEEIQEGAAANAAHIVACVNACAGINPEAVPKLLEACKEAQKLFHKYGIPDTAVRRGFRYTTESLDAAIALAEGEDK